MPQLLLGISLDWFGSGFTCDYKWEQRFLFMARQDIQVDCATLRAGLAVASLLVVLFGLIK